MISVITAVKEQILSNNGKYRGGGGGGGSNKLRSRMKYKLCLIRFK